MQEILKKSLEVWKYILHYILPFISSNLNSKFEHTPGKEFTWSEVSFLFLKQ